MLLTKFPADLKQDPFMKESKAVANMSLAKGRFIGSLKLCTSYVVLADSFVLCCNRHLRQAPKR